MKTICASDENLDFEAWARLLICRKVPDGYHHLINSEVVHDGAAILQSGDAFEVRIRERPEQEQILVTPFPTVVRPPNYSKVIGAIEPLRLLLKAVNTYIASMMARRRIRPKRERSGDHPSSGT
jgi:hypothetical protein